MLDPSVWVSKQAENEAEEQRGSQKILVQPRVNELLVPGRQAREDLRKPMEYLNSRLPSHPTQLPSDVALMP
jgi:hypothetical protein